MLQKEQGLWDGMLSGKEDVQGFTLSKENNGVGFLLLFSLLKILAEFLNFEFQ